MFLAVSVTLSFFVYLSLNQKSVQHILKLKKEVLIKIQPYLRFITLNTVKKEKNIDTYLIHPFPRDDWISIYFMIKKGIKLLHERFIHSMKKCSKTNKILENTSFNWILFQETSIILKIIQSFLYIICLFSCWLRVF